jgi:acyl-CoA thioester hydrolase
MTKLHIFPLRVYFEDTDTGGIVYYANYLKFAERARTEMLRSVGIESGRLLREDNITLAVKSCHVDYQKPAHLDDALEIYSCITKVGGASLHGEQKIKRNGYELVDIQIKLACMAMDGKPARLPNELRSTLNRLCST